jgi:integrase/recombinase XerC
MHTDDQTMIDAWARHRRRLGYATNTIRDGRRELHLLANHTSSGLFTVTHHQIADWLDQRGVTHADTRCNYLGHISAFYTWAINEDLTDRNPASRVERPKRRRRVPRPFPPDDLDHALAQAEPEIRAMLLCGYLAGLRCAEMAGLDREDFLDWRPDPVLIVTAAKGGDERTVPIHPALWRALQLAGMPAAGPVFPGRYGYRRSGQSISHTINRYLRSLAIAATAHQLRHGFATRALDGCDNLRTVQALLGHASPETTAKYAAFSARSARFAVESIALRLPRDSSLASPL